MKHLKLFENFNREQPLDKQDIIDLLEGTGINYTDIYEFPVRNIEEREFYLGWVIECDNPLDWVYHTPKNYQVNIGIDEDRLEFQWKVKSDMDFLLSKIDPRWKEIKEWLMDLFDDMEKKESEDGFDFYKESNFLFEQDLKNEYFWVSYKNIWSIFYSKYSMDYNQVQTFMWVILEHITNYKVVTTERYLMFSPKILEHITNYKVVTTFDYQDATTFKLEHSDKHSHITTIINYKVV
jgi:hypothetical protein